MKYLGIDFGDKHVGVAVSNDGGTMAFPLTTLDGGTGLIDEVSKLIEEKGVQAVVIGESKDFQGQDNKIMKKARVFAEELAQKTSKKVPVPIYFEPEFMTSVEARLIQGGGEKTHASAAALILKSYLDRKNN